MGGVELEEIWKSIKGYEGLYEISNFGRVKSMPKLRMKKEKIMKPSNRGGYLRISLSKDGISKSFYIHRLVAESFIPNLDGKKEVNHIDGNKKNNNASNLEWSTRSENMKHAFKTGLSKPKDNAISRAVIKVNLNTGEEIQIYKSIKDASVDMGLTPQSIFKALKRGRASGGYKWEYHHVGEHKHD